MGESGTAMLAAYDPMSDAEEATLLWADLKTTAPVSSRFQSLVVSPPTLMGSAAREGCSQLSGSGEMPVARGQPVSHFSSAQIAALAWRDMRVAHLAPYSESLLQKGLCLNGSLVQGHGDSRCCFPMGRRSCLLPDSSRCVSACKRSQQHMKRCRAQAETRCSMPYTPMLTGAHGHGSEATPAHTVPIALVSALCVTGKNRQEKLLGAIADWLAQMYAMLELVIVYDQWDEKTAALATRLKVWSERSVAGVPNVLANATRLRLVTLVENTDRTASLGRRRNMAVQAAHGHYVTQWDDDDMYDPRRVHEMVLALEHAARDRGKDGGKRAVLLNQWTVLDKLQAMAFTTGFGPKEGSILAERSLLMAIPYPETMATGMVRSNEGTGPSSLFGEDSIMVAQMLQLAHLMSAPYLYTYIIHGNNTCDQKHFQELRDYAHKFDESRSHVHRKTGWRILESYERAITLMRLRSRTNSIRSSLGITHFNLLPFDHLRLPRPHEGVGGSRVVDELSFHATTKSQLMRSIGPRRLAT